MQIRQVLVAFSLAAMLMTVGLGCAARPRAGGGLTAETPQDKVHRAQLDAMSREDAGAARRSRGDTNVPAPAVRDRRTGQLVIDQRR